jgi:GTPase SAR1 family protein
MNLMADEIKHYATGAVIPLGDGFTGKSVLSRLIINPEISDEELKEILLKTKKSYNIEIEFSSDEIEVENLPITTTLQFYVFPGQRQKISDKSTTFDEILSVFDCFPALLRISVLLLIYDVTRFSTLESLEIWLRFAIAKEWIYEDTLIVLVSNKVDLNKPDDKNIANVTSTILEYVNDHALPIDINHIKTLNTSCATLEGIKELRKIIVDWIATRGIRGVGIVDR